MAIARDQRGSRVLSKIAAILVFFLCAKVFVSILYEYRWYFPADFVRANFLLDRQDYFYGTYSAAFYTHIISGPIALLIGAFLVWSGTRQRFRRLHRLAGRIQLPLVVLLVVPSGMVMATKALTGPIAGAGFMVLAALTAGSMVATVQFARAGKLKLHRQWATRSFLLLCSPFLLRLMNGATIVSGTDSETTYQLTAWLSWILPLATYQLFQHRQTVSLMNVQLISTRRVIE